MNIFIRLAIYLLTICLIEQVQEIQSENYIIIIKHFNKQFMNQNSTSSGGVFSSGNSGQQQGSNQSIFGQGQNQGQGQSQGQGQGTFNNQNQGQSQGLFGNQQNQGQGQSQNVFSNTPQGGGQGMFQNNTQNPGQTQNAFSNPSQNQGQNPPTAQGQNMFGNSSENKGQNVFGSFGTQNQSKPQQKAPSFGQQQNKPQQKSPFGQNAFSNQAPSNQTNVFNQQQPNQAATSPFGNKPENKPFGNVPSQSGNQGGFSLGSKTEEKKQQNKGNNALQPPQINKISDPQTQNKSQGNMFSQKPPENTSQGSTNLPPPPKTDSNKNTFGAGNTEKPGFFGGGGEKKQQKEQKKSEGMFPKNQAQKTQATQNKPFFGTNPEKKPEKEPVKPNSGQSSSNQPFFANNQSNSQPQTQSQSQPQKKNQLQPPSQTQTQGQGQGQGQGQTGFSMFSQNKPKEGGNQDTQGTQGGQGLGTQGGQGQATQGTSLFPNQKKQGQGGTQGSALNQPKPQNQGKNLVEEQKNAAEHEWQRSGKSTNECINEWKSFLLESYDDLRKITSDFIDKEQERKQNKRLLDIFKQLRPGLFYSKQHINSWLESLERKQEQIALSLKKVNYEIGDQGFHNNYEHSLSLNLRSYIQLRNESESLANQSQQTSQSTSNEQLLNIYNNLDSVEKQILRMNNLVDHYFGSMQ